MRILKRISVLFYRERELSEEQRYTRVHRIAECIKSRAVLHAILMPGENMPRDALFRSFCCSPTLREISISIGVYAEYNPMRIPLGKTGRHRSHEIVNALFVSRGGNPPRFPSRWSK